MGDSVPDAVSERHEPRCERNERFPASERRPAETYAMNMRAAEAIVSSAPKPMKIFPIREVWSQVELSLLLLAITGAVAAATGASAEAIARVGAGWAAFVQRAIDVVELIGGDDLGLGGRLGVSRIVRRGLQNIVGPRGHRPGVAGRRVGGRQLCIGVGHRRRDRG